MKAKITTTITSYLDIETMTPEHEVEVESEDTLPEKIVRAIAVGGCKSAIKALDNE